MKRTLGTRRATLHFTARRCESSGVASGTESSAQMPGFLKYDLSDWVIFGAPCGGMNHDPVKGGVEGNQHNKSVSDP